MTWLADLIDAGISDPADATVARKMALQIEMGGQEGARAFLETCRRIGEGVDDPLGIVATLDRLELSDAIDLMGALVIRCFAAVRVDYDSRQAAQRGRRRLAAQADASYELLASEFGADALSWIVRLVGESILQISAIAATKAPIVRVETGLSLPSSLLAWDLYGDPERGRELVLRNRVGAPLVMPTAFEALSR